MKKTIVITAILFFVLGYLSHITVRQIAQGGIGFNQSQAFRADYVGQDYCEQFVDSYRDCGGGWCRLGVSLLAAMVGCDVIVYRP